MISSVLLGSLMLLYPAPEPVVWVFGDSLSSPHYSWAEKLDEAGYAQVRNFAQKGLTLSAIDMPDYMNCEAADQVVLWAGGNDAGSGVSLSDFHYALLGHLDFLAEKGCKTTVGQIPTFGFEEIDEVIQPYRDVLERLTRRYDNVTFVDVPWSQENAPDGIHQNESLHVWQALFFANQLGLELPDE